MIEFKAQFFNFIIVLYKFILHSIISGIIVIIQVAMDAESKRELLRRLDKHCIK